MSFHGHGRRRHHRGHDDDRRDYETPEQKIKNIIIKLGEVDAVQELPRVAKELQDELPINVPILSEGFRVAVTEQPYKIPYYATLIRQTYDPPPESETTTGAPPPIGRQMLEDFWKAFQGSLDKLLWRDMRLSIHLFAHLTMAGVISTQSMFDLLRSFAAVLDEFGVSHGRAKRAALCAAEGLMIAGPVFKENPSTDVVEIMNTIQSYIDSTAESKALVVPTVTLFSDATTVETADERLDAALAALQILNSSDFAQTSDSYPLPYKDLEKPTSTPFELPSVLVPPEVIELDTLSTDSGEDALVKKEEWAEFYIRIFDNDVSPDPTTPVGYAIRSGLLDLIDIFEVNRKECARLLLEFPKWCLPGTFKPRPGAPPPESVVPGKDWQLESTSIETILGCLFLLPEAPHKGIYYIALITELCKLSPSTVGPAVGKSIRKMYSLLADGLDVEIGTRFVDWFSIHMSNFNFQWVWKEWIPDLSLSLQHPKRAFMRRAAELEIRLSYFDRILKTLPEPMQSPDAKVMPAEAPGPYYEYDDPTNPHHDSALTVLNLLRGRAKADEVMSHLQTLKNNLETSDSDVNVDTVLRSIAVQSLLNIGSRSFSHFLNAIERYLPLLRNLAAGGLTSGGSPNFEARKDILNAVLSFWKNSKHMVVIVTDKLMQYQIVDPTDVVTWTFQHGHQFAVTETNLTVSALQWELLKGALNKANGRVVIARRRVAAVRKEEDEHAAREKAGDTAAMEVDADAKPEVPVVESAALTTALKAFATLTREQKTALSAALDGFVACLVSETDPNPRAKEVIVEKSWHNRINWDENDWLTWETWGWYRHFCREYSPYLRNYAKTLSSVSFAKIGPSGDPAVDLFKRIWNNATGQEA
ncbi:hypothetical protein K474DRAFT_1765807 [Panus rudis PR-1116 ss-1]|nr:hypothetical protein K474DRAFT_1765807 [Panus rudis PR-1116 ss-1]